MPKKHTKHDTTTVSGHNVTPPSPPPDPEPKNQTETPNPNETT